MSINTTESLNKDVNNNSKNGYLLKWIMSLISAVIVVSLSLWLTCFVYANIDKISINSSRLASVEKNLEMLNTTIKEIRISLEKNFEDHSIIKQDLTAIKVSLRIRNY